MSTAYFLVPAPGHYGDRAKVLSSHRTLDAARRAAKWSGTCIRVGEKVRGQEWLRVYEQTYPLAT